MAIFVTGDTHGAESRGIGSPDGYAGRFNTRNFPEQKSLTRNDTVIICGDFGGVWTVDRAACRESKDEKHWLDWLGKKPFTTVFVPGNHENYDRLTGVEDDRVMESWLFDKMPDAEKSKMAEGYPRERWSGGTVRVIRNNVLMAEPGVFSIDGAKCFMYGGAASHDVDAGILDPSDFGTETEFKRAYARMSAGPGNFRVRHVSWWNQEIPGETAQKAAREAIACSDGRFDFAFTHACPSSTGTQLGYAADDPVGRFLEEIKQSSGYSHWYSGHVHADRDLPGHKDHVVYGRIVRIA